MAQNLIFLSGPHGSGKTTLGRELEKVNPRIMIPELYSRNVKFNISDERYRQALKIASRAIENFEYFNIAKKNPSQIVLGNRCVYDVLAYNWIYYMKKWVSSEVYARYDSYAADSFGGENANPPAIVVNPDFDVIKKHLEERWKSKGKKWREDDLEYAKLAHEAYKILIDLGNILYLDHEIDLRDSGEIVRINDWVNEKAGIESLVAV